MWLCMFKYRYMQVHVTFSMFRILHLLIAFLLLEENLAFNLGPFSWYIPCGYSLYYATENTGDMCRHRYIQNTAIENVVYNVIHPLKYLILKYGLSSFCGHCALNEHQNCIKSSAMHMFDFFFFKTESCVCLLSFKFVTALRNLLHVCFCLEIVIW